jgi:hypothetical protein
MITKYDEFLLEQVISMINESNIVYSNKFRSLLKDIDSPVAKAISDIENKDIKVASNYFDISDNKETISFTADRKAQEIIEETKDKFAIVNHGRVLTHNLDQNGGIFNRLGYVPQGSNAYQPENGERGQIISKTVSPTSGKIFLFLKFGEGEQCVINKENVTIEDGSKEVWDKNRQSIRVGRGIRALLTSADAKFTDAEIEVFVNKYKAAFDRMNDIFRKFELVTGEQISYWYNKNRYIFGQTRGTLGSSCMAAVSARYFQIYTENPEVCSLLILKSDEDDTKIKGRALVWNLTSPEGVTFMDRIYTHDDSDVQLFRDYSKFKNWQYKYRNDSSSEPVTVGASGNNINHENLFVTIKNIDYTSYPYVDTLKFMNQEGDKKIISTDGDKQNIGCMEDTGGGISSHDDDDNECDNCGGSGRVECYSCDGSGVRECDDCEGSGKEECDNCDKGKVDCENCDGEGEIDGEKCDECDGKGKKDCEDCDGTGKTNCSSCDGDGEHDCNDCDGNGRVDCPDCN